MRSDDSSFYKFLAEQAIVYQRYDHPAVYTVEKAARLVTPLPGAKTKNLFLVNTATLVLSRQEVARFAELTGHALRVIRVPEKQD